MGNPAIIGHSGRKATMGKGKGKCRV